MTHDQLLEQAIRWHERGQIDDATLARIRHPTPVTLQEHLDTQCNSYERHLLYHLLDHEALAWTLDYHAQNTRAVFDRGAYPLEHSVGTHYDETLALVLVPLAAALLRAGRRTPHNPVISCGRPACPHRWIGTDSEAKLLSHGPVYCPMHRLKIRTKEQTVVDYPAESSPRICACGLLESDAAWAAGDRGCPQCKRVWPETLSNLGLRAASSTVVQQDGLYVIIPVYRLTTDELFEQLIRDTDRGITPPGPSVDDQEARAEAAVDECPAGDRG